MVMSQSLSVRIPLTFSSACTILDLMLLYSVLLNHASRKNKITFYLLLIFLNCLTPSSLRFVSKSDKKNNNLIDGKESGKTPRDLIIELQTERGFSESSRPDSFYAFLSNDQRKDLGNELTFTVGVVGVVESLFEFVFSERTQRKCHSPNSTLVLHEHALLFWQDNAKA